MSGHVLGPDEGKRMELPIPGSAVVFKAWGTRQAGDHDVAEFILGPGFPGPQPHVHRKHEELFYVLEGELAYLVGDQRVVLGQGSFIHVPPDTVHDFRNSGSVRARCLMVSSPAGLDRYFEDMAALGTSGTFSETALQELRLKYDTDEVDLAWTAEEAATVGG
jgi:mannose-6-phosphate isomerase-like protein (cupin superfamily)